MPIRLDSQSADFASRFAALLATKRETADDVEQSVRGIIADVRARGDQALIELTKKFDRVDLGTIGLRVSAAELDQAAAACDRRAIDALMLARDRIEAYHRRQKPSDDRFVDSLGVELGHRWTAIEAVGLYVPGGTAAYPSSVLMNAVPAKVAGVRAARHGGAVARRQAGAAGACRCEARGRRRGLSRSAARRRSRRLPMARRPSSRWRRSSGPATPMWRRRSGWCSAPSAST